MKLNLLIAIVLFMVQGPAAVSPVVFEATPRVVATGTDPVIAIRSSGAIGLLKVEKGNVYFQQSQDGGDTFQPGVRINTVAGEIAAHGENTPQLYSRARSELYALWQGGSSLKLSRSPDWGETWGAPVTVPSSSSQGFYTLNVSPKGAVHVAWLGDGGLHIARSTNLGASFEKTVKVAGPVCPCCRPSIAFTDENTVHMGWRDVRGDNLRDMMVATSTDGGKTWSSGSLVAVDNFQINGCPHSGPSMAVLGKRLFVTWWTVKNDVSGLYLAYSDDGGRTFSRGQSVSQGTLDPNHSYMVAGNGRAHIVFQARDARKSDGWGKIATYYREVSPAGVLSPLLRVGQLSGSAVYPTLALENSGRLYAAWTELTDKGSNILFVRGRRRDTAVSGARSTSND